MLRLNTIHPQATKVRRGNTDTLARKTTTRSNIVQTHIIASRGNENYLENNC